MDDFLPVTQNWIYPQIVGVAGVSAAVMCGQRINETLFPLAKERLILSTYSRKESWGVPRLVNSLAVRLGRRPFVFRAQVRRWEPQLIHAHFGTTGWKILPLKRRLGKPLVTSFYGVDGWALPEGSVRWRKNLNELFRVGELFLVEGPAMSARLAKLGCPNDKIKVLRLGINSDLVRNTERDFKQPLKILMMARFVEKKGFVDGIEACAEARRLGANLSLRIIGDANALDPVGKNIKDRLMEVAARPELLGRVYFDGFVKPDRSCAIMADCNVFLCPSKHGSDGDAEGGSPVVLTEAMGMGLLCIGTRHCDIPEVIKENETGYLCESGDVAGLARLILRATEKPEEAQKLAQRGRQHIAENFSVNKQVVQLGEVYSRLVGRCG